MGLAAVLSVVLGAAVLPDHVGGPGAGRFAAGGGVRGGDPIVELRVGVLDFLAVNLEAVYHPVAPLLGGGLRIAAGRTRGLLYASAWAESHVRPVITTDVTETIAGSDIGGGFGIAVVSGLLVTELDGGLQVGLPVYEADLEVDESAVDQQGGLFATQRLRVGIQIAELAELMTTAHLSVPVDGVDFNRRDRDVLGRWDLRLGAGVLVRF